jgi:hypothetical protein
MQKHFPNLDENTYWTALEFRVCREFPGMPERHRRYLWCDGFSPLKYILDSSDSRITGKTWICNGQRQEIWEFTLFLDKQYASREEIDWTILLPPPDVTRWIALDEDRKIIQIEPSAAVPDFPISN